MNLCILFELMLSQELESALNEKYDVVHIDDASTFYEYAEKDIALICWNGDTYFSGETARLLLSMRRYERLYHAAHVVFAKDHSRETYFLDNGCLDYFVLPISKETLLSHLQKAINLKKILNNAQQLSWLQMLNRECVTKPLSVFQLHLDTGDIKVVSTSSIANEEFYPFDTYLQSFKQGGSLFLKEDLEKIIQCFSMQNIFNTIADKKTAINQEFYVMKRNGEFARIKCHLEYEEDIYHCSWCYGYTQIVDQQEQAKQSTPCISTKKSPETIGHDVDFVEYDHEQQVCKSSGNRQLFYCSKESIPEMHLEWVHVEDQKKALHLLDHVKQGVQSDYCDLRIVDETTNEYKWWRYTLYVSYDENGIRSKSVLLGVQVENEYSKQDKYNKALASSGISIWTLDIPTKSATKIIGLSADTELLIAENVIENVTDSIIKKGLIHEDDVPSYLAMFQRVYNGENAVTGQVRHWVKKTNSYVWREFHFELIETVNGNPKTSLFTIRDISAKKNSDILYRQELENYNTSDNDLLAFARFNITKNEVENFNVLIPGIKVNHNKKISPLFSERIKYLFTNICVKDEELQKLDGSSLLKQFHEGNRSLSLSYWGNLKKTNQKIWIETTVKTVERPLTNEIIAFSYTKEKTKQHLKDGMMAQLAQHSFERCAAIFVERQELRPIIELNAKYSPYWNHRDYNAGLWMFCNQAINEKDRARVFNGAQISNIVKHLETEETYAIQYDVTDVQGNPHRKETSFTYLDKENQVILMALKDIASYENLRRLSEIDALTEIYNRNKLFVEVRKLLDTNENKQFAFYIIDIDRFNQYNGAFGEEEGDILLKHVAKLIQKHCNHTANTIYGRLNSDVFAICIEHNDVEEGNILDALVNEMNAYRIDYSLSLSIGCYVIEDNHMNVEEIRLRASKATKKSKDDQNHNISYFTKSDELQLQQEIVITSEMKKALKKHQFEVFLQPKYALNEGRFSGAEALVRWRHPERGLISPGFFIPIFERNGFIIELDQYIWEEVCILLRKWLDQGLQPNPISINVSRISLYHPQLISILEKLTTKYDISPKLLQLEITESAYVSDKELMVQKIEDLHKAGFTILMDDFGSGYSSLNTLKDFHVDILKIDMKFLSNKDHVKESEIIIASAVKMAKWLGMEVVMEGVETEQQKEFLSGISCDYVQGYYYAKPMSVEHYEQGYVDQKQKIKPNQEKNKPKEIYLKQIVAIDDDEITRELYQEILGTHYEIQLFSTAETALEYLYTNASRVGLILVDNILPGMHGVDFLEYCKWESQLQMIPKVVCSSDNRSEVRKRVRLLGGDDYLLKPIDRKALLACCRKWMDMSSRYYLDTVERALNQLNEAACIFKYDNNKAELEYGNEALYRMMECGVDEVFYSYQKDAFKSLVHPHDYEKSLSIKEDVFKTGNCSKIIRVWQKEKKKYLWLQISGKLIHEVGGKAIYYTLSDITDSRELIVRTNLLKECQEELTMSVDTDDAITTVLHKVNEYYQGDRIYTFEFDFSLETMKNTYEVVKDGVSKVIDSLQAVPLSCAYHWLDCFKRSEYVQIPDLEKIKEDPNRMDEYNTLKPQGIQSLIAVPLIYRNRLIGFLGVDNPRIHMDDANFLKDITYFLSHVIQEKKLQKKLIYLSYTDALCDVGSRNAYEQYLVETNETKLLSLGVVYADVNGLKHANDEHGHESGDSLLVKASSFLVKHFGKENVYRLSGDEFVVSLEDVDQESFATKVKELKEDLNQQGERILSIGYAYQNSPIHIQEAIRDAESHMYKDKAAFYTSNPEYDRRKH